MDDEIELDPMKVVGIRENDTASKLIARFADLGLIEYRFGDWRITEVGKATLEAWDATKQ